MKLYLYQDIFSGEAKIFIYEVNYKTKNEFDYLGVVELNIDTKKEVLKKFKVPDGIKKDNHNMISVEVPKDSYDIEFSYKVKE
jgi:hypothetical protein